MKQNKFIPLENFPIYDEEEMLKRTENFYELMKKRRTVRNFSDKNIPQKIIENCLLTAGTSPSGANKQPWHFVVVSDSGIKRKIRIAAEKEEKEFYENRATREWLNDLGPLGTDEHKPFLETAPYLIVIFTKKYDAQPDGSRSKNYYSTESTGIACGMLITAVHNAGLATLTHTPSPMNFLNEILDRPANEKPYLILVVGYPAVDAEVPDLKRKSLEEISTFL